MKSTIKRRPFGNTGLHVSEISFGAMNLRSLPDNAAANKLINDILDQGVNLIDTARAYDTKPGKGTVAPGLFISSEIELGRAIAARTDISEPIVIITKGHIYTPEDFDTQLGESCERLQIRGENGKLYIGKTEIILCYFTHGIKPDRWEAMEKTGLFAHAEKRRDEGLFHYLGFSSHSRDSETIQKAIEGGYYQICELNYNVYDDTLEDLIKLAHDRGMAVVNMKAFGGSGMVDISKQIGGLTGISYADMARFCLGNPYISTIDAGVRSIGEFLADADAANLPPLSASERAALREKAAKVEPYLKTICRECMHCVEKFDCPRDINFPKILGMHGRYTVSRSLGFDISGFAGEYAAFNPGASACAACGECNAWCEYRLDIPAMLKTAAQDFV
jgi:predicted aldo/keto reductase-like oxidoreductase